MQGMLEAALDRPPRYTQTTSGCCAMQGARDQADSKVILRRRNWVALLDT